MDTLAGEASPYKFCHIFDSLINWGLLWQEKICIWKANSFSFRVNPFQTDSSLQESKCEVTIIVSLVKNARNRPSASIPFYSSQTQDLLFQIIPLPSLKAWHWELYCKFLNLLFQFCQFTLNFWILSNFCFKLLQCWTTAFMDFKGKFDSWN